MNLIAATLFHAILIVRVRAFVGLSSYRPFVQHFTNRHPFIISSTVEPTQSQSPSSTATDTISWEKKSLIDTVERLKQQYGSFLVDTSAKIAFQNAVAALEQKSVKPSLSSDILGTWELACTTVTSSAGIDTSSFPNPLQQIRESVTKTINKYVSVQQIVEAPTDGGLEIERIDHVIEYMPPKELSQVFDNLPEPLQNVNINPLDVSKSKLVLIHKAAVESTMNPFSISLSLKSIVLNVAGTSTFLDPNGKDVTGINIPLGEFLNGGTFETTYMDNELRISRGNTVAGDQLRVFVRPGRVEKDWAVQEIVEGASVGQGVDSEMDVDEVVDVDFESNTADSSTYSSTTGSGSAPTDVQPSDDDESETEKSS